MSLGSILYQYNWYQISRQANDIKRLRSGAHLSVFELAVFGRGPAQAFDAVHPNAGLGELEKYWWDQANDLRVRLASAHKSVCDPSVHGGRSSMSRNPSDSTSEAPSRTV